MELISKKRKHFGMIHALDQEAKRLGVPRQSIIKIWLAERLEKTPAWMMGLTRSL